MQEITLKFSLEECNLLLKALAKMPYEKVFSLVTKFQSQASRQINGANETQVEAPVDEESES